MTEIEALLAQLERDPDDLATYLVLADALTLAGDPRGELIGIQHALAAAPEDAGPAEHPRDRAELVRRERELVAACLPSSLRPLADREEVALEYRLGFLDRLVVGEALGRPELAEPLATVLASPEARLLRTVMIAPLERTLELRNYPVRGALARLGAGPRSVRRLELGGAFGRDPGFRTRVAFVDDVRGVLARFPALDELVVDLGCVRLTWDALASERLRRLAWIAPYVHRDDLAPLAEARLPALERFALWTGAAYAVDLDPLAFDAAVEAGSFVLPAPSDALSLADLEPVLAMLDRCPALRELAIANHAGALAELLAAIASHPCAARIAVLDLSWAELEDRDVRALAASLGRFPALRELVLDGVELGERHRDQLAGAIRVTGRSRRLGGRAARYRLVRTAEVSLGAPR